MYDDFVLELSTLALDAPLLQTPKIQPKKYSLYKRSFYMNDPVFVFINVGS